MTDSTTQTRHVKLKNQPFNPVTPTPGTRLTCLAPSSWLSLIENRSLSTPVHLSLLSLSGLSSLPSPPGTQQNKPKRHPPDQIIKQTRQCEFRRQRSRPHRLRHPHRTKNLSQKPHQHNRPMHVRRTRRDQVSNPIHPHNHPHALPYLGIVRPLHPHQVKHRKRKQHRPRPPCQVVNPRQNQAPEHPPRRNPRLRKCSVIHAQSISFKHPHAKTTSWKQGLFSPLQNIKVIHIENAMHDPPKIPPFSKAFFDPSFPSLPSVSHATARPLTACYDPRGAR